MIITCAICRGPLCESCPTPGSDEYNTLCAGGSGFRPNGDTVLNILNAKIQHNVLRI